MTIMLLLSSYSLLLSRIVSPSTTTIRLISTTTAKQLLGFHPSDRPTIKELRAAYFEAAKKTHPDVAISSSNSSSCGGEEFCRITEAYERLLTSREVVTSSMGVEEGTWKISHEEENDYRQACQAILGIPAEIVEESKRNPMFRHWLGGNTDGAQHWRAFFAGHGGLAQKLQQPTAFIGSGQEVAAFETRRRRKR